MKRIDWLSNMIELWRRVYRESEGTVKAVARARLLELLDENESLTAGQGQEMVEV